MRAMAGNRLGQILA